MEKRSDKEREWAGDMPVRTEDIAYAADQLVTCGKCGRANPPNRFKCLYCAADLEISPVGAGEALPGFRKLENWEKGYNVIYLSGSAEDMAGAAKSFLLDSEVFSRVEHGGVPVPVARVESEREANILSDALRQKGIETAVVSDRALAAEMPPKRLRSITFNGEELILTLFNTGESERVERDNLALIVTGAIFARKTESIEKRKKRESKTLEEWETSSDEHLVDIYSSKDPTGWRIPAKGFDFSCLENEKGMIAGENLARLVKRLREFAPLAKLADGYLAARKELGMVWEVERRNDFQGFRRSGFGKSDLGKVSSSNNSDQFTKYSRLQWHLL